MKELTISGSPHLHGNESVKNIMWGVVLAMVPAMLVSFWYFGLPAVTITLVAIVSCVGFEYLISKYILQIVPSITDGSAVITGILLSFNVPSNLPAWEMVVGSLVAIGIAKMAFGGLGKNWINPALAARVFMLVSFPVDMTSWPVPQPLFSGVDGLTGATSLGILKEGLAKGETVSAIATQLPDYARMFWGQIGGSLGEVSAAAILLGGLYLLWRRIISWHIPFSYLMTVVVFTGILWIINPEMYIDPLFHLLAGGLMLGAFFMATDMVTSPMTHAGQLVFGLGCGVLTVLIRLWGAYPEGVSFAIILMNAATPLINLGFKPKRFGEEKAHE